MTASKNLRKKVLCLSELFSKTNLTLQFPILFRFIFETWKGKLLGKSVT